MAAHLLDVSLPSRPSSSRFNNLTCRSFIGVPARRCQNRVFDSTASSALEHVVVRLAIALDLR